MQIQKDGLLASWYEYWVELGGTPPWQENLCHFVRVLLIWAPLRWFFLARTKKVVAPWSVALAVLVVTGIWLPQVLSITALIIGALVGFVVFLCVAIAAVTAIALATKRTARYLYRLDPVYVALNHRLFNGKIHTWIPASGALMVAGVLLLPTPFNLWAVVPAFLVLASVASAIFAVTLILALAGVSRIVEMAWESEPVAVAREYAYAKKQRICPFIEFV